MAEQQSTIVTAKYKHASTIDAIARARVKVDDPQTLDIADPNRLLRMAYPNDMLAIEADEIECLIATRVAELQRTGGDSLEEWLEQRVRDAKTISTSKFKSASAMRAIATARMLIRDPEQTLPDYAGFLRVAQPNLMAFEAQEIEEIVEEYIVKYNFMKRGMRLTLSPQDVHTYG